MSTIRFVSAIGIIKKRANFAAPRQPIDFYDLSRKFIISSESNDLNLLHIHCA